jgi:hypothetical protein
MVASVLVAKYVCIEEVSLQHSLFNLPQPILKFIFILLQGLHNLVPQLCLK